MQTEFLSIDSYSFILVVYPTALCVLKQGGLINVQQLITSLLIIMLHVDELSTVKYTLFFLGIMF